LLVAAFEMPSRLGGEGGDKEDRLAVDDEEEALLHCVLPESDFMDRSFCLVSIVSSPYSFVSFDSSRLPFRMGARGGGDSSTLPESNDVSSRQGWDGILSIVLRV